VKAPTASLTISPTPVDVFIFPNPSDEGKFSIVLKNYVAGSQVLIFDVQGKLKYSSIINNNKTELNTGLNKGIYMLKIINGQNIFNQKLIIN
jgi:hypothetical protein